MRVPYQKLPLNYEAQLQQLVDRGMLVQQPAEALQTLKLIGYYRLSGYWHLFRKMNPEAGCSDQFEDGTQFDEVVRLYEFDRNLRLLVMDAIERVEIAVRTKLTSHFAQTYGTFGHLDAGNFHPSFDHNEWLQKLRMEAERSSESFIVHYKTKYEGFPNLPLWMVSEIMSLGSLSFFYKGLRNQQQKGVEDKKAVAEHFGIHYRRLGDWLHTLTYVRNVCAHHARLWNRELAIRAERTNEAEWNAPTTPRNDRIFYVLLMLRYLLRTIGWGDQWHGNVTELLEPISTNRKYRAGMGLPENWKEHPIWK